ncbi:MAG: histidine kinase [Vicinamibacterales bacterium]|nr:histidine kinase [Vicinamibacterales bacterium]
MTGAPELLHLVGYLTGASLYGLLLVMGLGGRGPGHRPVLGTAALGLAWNVGELATHLLGGLGFLAASAWMAALSYAALSFLAAVAVHAAGRGPAQQPGPSAPMVGITRLAYACATVSAVMQLMAAATARPLPWPPALLVMTGGLAALSLALLATTHRQPHGRRVLWIATLALLAVSALHLGRWHGESEGWATELIGHQASIPLALAILYQDYRFGFVDTFLKRALTFLAVVAVAFAGWSAAQFAPGAPAGTALFAGLLLSMWVATALLFPWLQRRISLFVDRVLLARVDYASVTEAVSAVLHRCESEDTVMRSACEAVSRALGAAPVSWRLLGSGERPGLTEILVATAEGPHRALTIGPLHGGRRLLFDDRQMLERVAGLAGRRIDAIRLAEERYARQSQERELRALSTESELRALRAQINPHFLFNALTAIGYLIEHAPGRAVRTLMRLTTLLRAVLKSEGEFTTLGQECHLIECYLDIERERFEERLTISLDVPDDLAAMTIPALIVQPLVENAIKHGVARARNGGSVTVRARVTSRGDEVAITVANTGAPLESAASTEGIGLRNVSRRLRCYYGESARFDLRRGPAGDTIAEVTLPLGPSRAATPETLEHAS